MHTDVFTSIRGGPTPRSTAVLSQSKDIATKVCVADERVQIGLFGCFVRGFHHTGGATYIFALELITLYSGKGIGNSVYALGWAEGRPLGGVGDAACLFCCPVSRLNLARNSIKRDHDNRNR